MNIQITDCESSQLTGHGYDAATETLALRFKGGAVYHYKGVPADTYDDLVASDSKGSFLNKSIKGVFEYAKQPKEEKEDGVGQ